VRCATTISTAFDFSEAAHEDTAAVGNDETEKIGYIGLVKSKPDSFLYVADGSRLQREVVAWQKGALGSANIRTSLPCYHSPSRKSK
jgi:hypothetical protein